MKKKYIILLVIGIFVLIMVAINIPPKSVKEELLGIEYNIKGNETDLKYNTENPVVAMHIEEYGSIVIELYPDIAPNTVNNFISLVKSGFYDNNTIHRLMKDFVLQGGDPTGSGSGGPGYTIKGEFLSNGFENNLSHEKWVVSMARASGNPNSAGSQFFICLDNASHLDGDYAAFGKIIDGFDIIEKIEEDEMVLDSKSGSLKNNLIIEKALVDLQGKKYKSVIKND